MTQVDATFFHFKVRCALSHLPCFPWLKPTDQHPTEESRQDAAMRWWTSPAGPAFVNRRSLRLLPLALEEFSMQSFTTTIRYLLSLSERSIKPAHRCHISQIPSVDQTSRLWKEDIPAGKFRARWLRGLFPSYFLSCTLSLCCLCNADKSIHQKISSVKLNQERSCQRERNRLN